MRGTFALTPGKRVLYLTKDPELIRRQLRGELTLSMDQVRVEDLLDDINTDAMTPAWVCFNHRPEDLAREAYAGIIVNDHLLTADPNISAIGDCALYASHRFGGSLRLESVQNATDHARCVAARLTGDAKLYDGLPWFWSDQGPDKLQMVGLTTGYDRVVVRGDRGQGAFSAFCYKSGQLVGIESVNRAGDHMFGRRLLAAHGSITPEQAADSSFDLKSALG